MRQSISDYHNLDDDGNPAGGTSLSRGISIVWQNGPVPRDAAGVPTEDPNGAFVEGVIQAAIQRLEWYETTRFACQENRDAIAALNQALAALDSRTADRQARGVEGLHEL